MGVVGCACQTLRVGQVIQVCGGLTLSFQAIRIRDAVAFRSYRRKIGTTKRPIELRYLRKRVLGSVKTRFWAICRQARSNSVPSCLPVTRAQFFLFISPLALLRSLYPYSGIRETHCCSVLSQVRSRDRNRDSHTPKRHHPPT